MPYTFFNPHSNYAEFCAQLLADARHITNQGPFKMALLAFNDLRPLKEMLEEPIDFSQSANVCDYLSGFDWLDAAVRYKDEQAIEYFQSRLSEPEFFEAYEYFKNKIKPECKLKKYEKIARKPCTLR